MIEPLKFTTTLTQGINKAVATIEQNGSQVKFEKSTPEFAQQVSKILDEFTYGDKVEKSVTGLQQLAKDVFERTTK